jgi:hypothetical protein
MGPSVAKDLEWFKAHLPKYATLRVYEYPESGDTSVSLRYGPEVELRDIEGGLLGAIVGEVSRRWRIALIIEHALHHSAARFRHRTSRAKLTRDGTTLHLGATVWRRISMAPRVFEAADSTMPGNEGIRERMRVRYKSAQYRGVQVRLYYTRAPRVPVRIP